MTTGSADASRVDGIDNPGLPPWDFASLRQRGLQFIQGIAGTTWTDHNAHDPGITILEQLCYVLTDLAYRANYDVRDLLAGAGSDSGLFRPSEILTTNPVTLLDLRKLVLDVEGVKNVWIEPVTALEPPVSFDPAEGALVLGAAPPAEPVELRGVYRVLVAPGSSGLNPTDIVRRLNASRPLGLDFLAPEIKQQKIAVLAEIEIDHAHLPSDVLRAVYQAAAEYVLPRIRFYSLEEMLARGRSLAEIFEGPPLRHGFIDSDDLAPAERATELHTSDLLALLMEIDGVRAVHQLGLQKDGQTVEPWVLELDSSQIPALDLQATKITLVRGRVQWSPPDGEIALITSELLRADSPPALSADQLDPSPPAGSERQVARYHSLQHHLPEVYGLGAAGLPTDATPARRAQARQLRAYLMMFDQILANCFSQTAHGRDLFSFAPGSGTLPTYRGQLPTDVPFADEILSAGFDADALQAMLETPESAAARQQKFLDHLLARFAEDFGDYKLQSQVWQRTPAARMDPQRAFLRDYPAVSGGHGRGFDYTRPSWGDANSANVSGLEKRVAFKLGLVRYRRRALADLSADDEGGFHLVEHLLLRPGQADTDAATGAGDPTRAAPLFLAQPLNKDPYSAQLSFIFPDWITGFLAQSSRDYVETTVREETPAHLGVRVQWFTRDEMAAFEPAYRAWLDSMVLPA